MGVRWARYGSSQVWRYKSKLTGKLISKGIVRHTRLAYACYHVVTNQALEVCTSIIGDCLCKQKPLPIEWNWSITYTFHHWLPRHLLFSNRFQNSSWFSTPIYAGGCRCPLTGSWDRASKIAGNWDYFLKISWDFGNFWDSRKFGWDCKKID